jgi:hypothetical protein
VKEFTNSVESGMAAPEAGHFETGNGNANWRQSKWLAVGELVVVALVFVADFKHLIFFSKTPYLLLFGWLSLWVRKLRWRDVGLSRFRNWKTTLGLGIVASSSSPAFARQNPDWLVSDSGRLTGKQEVIPGGV